MQANEKSNGSLTMAQPANAHDHIAPQEELAGLYQAGYQAGFARGRESGYRQGYEAGFGDGRRQGSDFTAPGAVGNAPCGGGVMKSRLFGLPCAKCRRLMYCDETRCAYCKAPLAKLVGPPSATECYPENGSQARTDGELEPLRVS